MSKIEDILKEAREQAAKDQKGTLHKLDGLINQPIYKKFREIKAHPENLLVQLVGQVPKLGAVLALLGDKATKAANKKWRKPPDGSLPTFANVEHAVTSVKELGEKIDGNLFKLLAALYEYKSAIEAFDKAMKARRVEGGHFAAVEYYAWFVSHYEAKVIDLGAKLEAAGAKLQESLPVVEEASRSYEAWLQGVQRISDGALVGNPLQGLSQESKAGLMRDQNKRDSFMQQPSLIRSSSAPGGSLSVKPPGPLGQRPLNQPNAFNVATRNRSGPGGKGQG